MSQKPAVLKRKQKQPRKRQIPEISNLTEYDPVTHASCVDEHLDSFVTSLDIVSSGVDDFISSTSAIDSQIDGFLSSTTDPNLQAFLKRCKRYAPMGALLLKDVRELQEKMKHFSTDLELIRSSVFQHSMANVQSDFELRAHLDAGASRVPPKISSAPKKTPNPGLFPSQLR